MQQEQQAQSQRVWEADLSEPGRKLTVDELRALEAMHQCKLLQEINQQLTYMTLALASLEGRFDRLEQYLMRIDARYPGSGTPELGLALVGPGGG